MNGEGRPHSGPRNLRVLTTIPVSNDAGEQMSAEAVVSRCLRSVLRVADLIEEGADDLAVETCHLIASDLENLLALPEGA